MYCSLHEIEVQLGEFRSAMGVVSVVTCQRVKGGMVVQRH